MQRTGRKSRFLSEGSYFNVIEICAVVTRSNKNRNEFLYFVCFEQQLAHLLKLKRLFWYSFQFEHLKVFFNCKSPFVSEILSVSVLFSFPSRILQINQIAIMGPPSPFLKGWNVYLYIWNCHCRFAKRLCRKHTSGKVAVIEEVNTTGCIRRRSLGFDYRHEYPVLNFISLFSCIWTIGISIYVYWTHVNFYYLEFAFAHISTKIWNHGVSAISTLFYIQLKFN